MSKYEIFSLVLSCIAVFISVLSYFMAKKANSTASANTELYINERITNTKEKVSEISMLMSSLTTKRNRTNEEEEQLKIFQLNFKAAVENNLNAYEEACAKYLDNKVDKKRFHKQYKTEIRQLVENEQFKEYFDRASSRYRTILKTYNEWENLEQ